VLIKLIGDSHGDLKPLITEYKKNNFDFMISVGDLGVDENYSYLKTIVSDNFKLVAGNHEDYSVLEKYDFYLGDFGLVPGTNGKVYFVRGAETPNYNSKSPKVNWWPQEKLDLDQMEACLVDWERNCANVELLVSHTCPREFTTLLIQPGETLGSCPTEHLLSRMREIWTPTFHVFGHYHKNWHTIVNTKDLTGQIKTSKIFCLDKNSTMVVRV
jgi:hypothetical protein